MSEQSDKEKNKLTLSRWMIGAIVVPIFAAVISATIINVSDWLFPKPPPTLELPDSTELHQRLTKLENQLEVLVALLREKVAKVKMTAGADKLVAASPLTLATEVDKENIEVKNSSIYLGRKLYVGQRAWRWTIYISADKSILAKIKCVTYTLHPTFPNPERKVCQRGRVEKAFSLTARGWGTFSVDVLISFKNGSELRKTHQLVFVPAE